MSSNKESLRTDGILQVSSLFLVHVRSTYVLVAVPARESLLDVVQLIS